MKTLAVWKIIPTSERALRKLTLEPTTTQTKKRGKTERKEKKSKDKDNRQKKTWSYINQKSKVTDCVPSSSKAKRRTHSLPKRNEKSGFLILGYTDWNCMSAMIVIPRIWSNKWANDGTGRWLREAKGIGTVRELQPLNGFFFTQDIEMYRNDKTVHANVPLVPIVNTSSLFSRPKRGGKIKVFFFYFFFLAGEVVYVWEFNANNMTMMCPNGEVFYYPVLEIWTDLHIKINRWPVMTQFRKREGDCI